MFQLNINKKVPRVGMPQNSNNIAMVILTEDSWIVIQTEIRKCYQDSVYNIPSNACVLIVMV